MAVHVGCSWLFESCVVCKDSEAIGLSGFLGLLFKSYVVYKGSEAKTYTPDFLDQFESCAVYEGTQTNNAANKIGRASVGKEC